MARKFVTLSAVLVMVATALAGCCVASDVSDADGLSETIPLPRAGGRSSVSADVGSEVSLTFKLDEDDVSDCNYAIKEWGLGTSNDGTSKSLNGLTITCSDGINVGVSGNLEAKTVVTIIYGNESGDSVRYYYTITATTPTSYHYAVVYYANGGSGSMSSTVVSGTSSVSSDVTLASNGFTRDGYTFIGWKINNTGNTLLPGETVPVAADTSLPAYAQWVQNTTSTSLSASQLYVVEGESVIFTVTGSCDDGATYTAVASSTGGTLSKTSGISSGDTLTFTAPQVDGVKEFTVTVTSAVDGYAQSSATVSIIVKDALVLGTPSAGDPISS